MKEKRAKALVKRGVAIRQVAVLPFRRSAEGELSLLLMTSRQTRRFVIPKGWPMAGKPDWKAAALEAKQEAGLLGSTDHEPLGAYRYWKRLQSIFVPVHVSVYLLQVTEELPRWRERGQRERAWVSLEQARMLIDEPELITLIDTFEAAHAPAPTESGFSKPS